MTLVEVVLYDFRGWDIKSNTASPVSLRMLVLRTQPPCCEEAQTSPHRETTWGNTYQPEPAEDKGTASTNSQESECASLPMILTPVIIA